MQNSSSATWAITDGNYTLVTDVAEKLPAGMYTIRRDRRDVLCLTPKEIVTSGFLELPDTPQQDIFNLLNSFVEKRDIFKQYGFVHKRGILMYGPPGSGKTTIVQQAAKQIIDQDGIVIYGGYPPHTAQILSDVRQVEPERQIVVLFEEIESMVQEYGEHELLSLLDGELQINNVIFLATSNFPELLSQRLLNRPSRFDELIYVGMPTAKCRRSYIQQKFPQINAHECADWVERTDGMSLAHVQELVIAVKCLGSDPNIVLKRLKALDSDSPNSGDFERKPFGFIGGEQSVPRSVGFTECTGKTVVPAPPIFNR